MIFVDADGQYNPKYLPNFIEKLNKYLLVFGYRVLKKNIPWVRRTGNRIVAWLI